MSVVGVRAERVVPYFTGKHKGNRILGVNSICLYSGLLYMCSV